MMIAQPDTLTVAVGAALIALTLLMPLCSPFFRRVKPDEEEAETGNDAQLPPLSVVMTIQDDAEAVEKNLPLFLEQDYPNEFRVIVVDESANEYTRDILKQLKARYAHLYTTFIPETSHYLSRRKLALTLGIKAAKTEWMVLTDIHCCPANDQWLRSMAKEADDQHDIVLGLTCYDEETPGYWRFDRLMTNCYQMRRALSGTAYRYDGRALAFRHSKFMSNNGFLHNLMYLRGEYDFLVNEHAEAGRAAVSVQPATRLVQERPSKKAWDYDHLYYLESRRHMSRGTGWRWIHFIDQTMLHLGYLLPVGVLLYAVLKGNELLGGIAVVGLILTLVVRTILVLRAARNYGDKLFWMAVPLYELRTVWQQLVFMLRYRTSDKYEFIRR